MWLLVKRKLQNKKILNGCLLLGITLFIAIAACTPMFKRGSLNMLIQSKFDKRIETQNVYPAVLSRSAQLEGDNLSYTAVADKMDGYLQTWQRYMEIPQKEIQRHIWITGSNIKRQYGFDTDWTSIGCIPDMEEHIQILTGVSYNDAVAKDNVYPCLMTEMTMDNLGLVLDEEVEFTGIEDGQGKTLKLKVVGIFDEQNYTDIFWHVEADEFGNQLFVSEKAMEDIIENYSMDSLNYELYLLLDYMSIHSGNVSNLSYYLQQFHEKDSELKDNFSDIFEDYVTDRQFVDTIFWVLELPVFVLLLAFVYMVSGQILSMETGEIAMFGSRGFSKKQIMAIYLYQSGILAGIGIVLGMPLGYLLCKLAASTNGFLQFSLKSTAVYTPTFAMLPYAVIAAFAQMAFLTIPVAQYAKDSVVEQKQKKHHAGKGDFLEKYFIDLLLLMFSLYLLYNYNKQKSLLAMQVMTGEDLDPVVFLNVTIFLFACGLLGHRLLRYLVRFIFYLGRKKWQPHTYASFLQIIRAGARQRFLSVFLIFTISMGIFNANVAGTINENNELRTRYNVGADVVLSEHWTPQVYMDSVARKAVRYYEEPDYQRYNELSEHTVSRMTRVVRDDEVRLSAGGNSMSDCSMQAIHTKEFGETANLPDGLNEIHCFHYLNALAKNGSGILVSRNVAEKFGLKEGDRIRYTRQNKLSSSSEKDETTCSGTVCGIFDAWPGYEQYDYGYNEDGVWEERQQYMIVVNYAYAVNVFGPTPYQIWMELKPGGDFSDIESFLSEKEIKADSLLSTEKEVEEIRNSAMIQITNGLFSLSFLVSILLCTIGFLIYWITSMKQRELLFGIYRAMGMRMQEVNRMLILEQLFSSMLAGIFGGITGILTSLLHTKLLALVYLPRNHNIPLTTYMDGVDMARLMLLVLCMIGICLVVLRRQIKSSNMLQAIKLGEDS